MFKDHRRECIVSGWPSWYSARDVVVALVAVDGIPGPISGTPVASHMVPDASVSSDFHLTNYTTSFPDILELGTGRHQLLNHFAPDAR
jgi:hypothetical protein